MSVTVKRKTLPSKSCPAAGDIFLVDEEPYMFVYTKIDEANLFGLDDGMRLDDVDIHAHTIKQIIELFEELDYTIEYLGECKITVETEC